MTTATYIIINNLNAATYIITNNLNAATRLNHPLELTEC